MKRANLQKAPEGIGPEAQRQWRHLAQELATYKKQFSIAREQVVILEARSHDLKLRAKSAENSLRVLEPDAHRYRWLKKLGCEDAFAFLRRWETDGWDRVIDKALNKL